MASAASEGATGGRETYHKPSGTPGILNHIKVSAYKAIHFETVGEKMALQVSGTKDNNKE